MLEQQKLLATLSSRGAPRDLDAIIKQFEADIVRAFYSISIEPDNTDTSAKQTKVKHRIAVAYTKLIQLQNAPYSVKFNEEKANFELVDSTKELAEQKKILEDKIKLFKSIIEIKNQLSTPQDLENIAIYKDQLKKIKSSDLTDNQNTAIYHMLKDYRMHQDFDSLFNVSILEKQLAEVDKIKKSGQINLLPNLQNQLNNLNSLVDDTIKDFKQNTEKEFQKKFLENKKIGYVMIALVFITFAVAAGVCAVIAPPLIPLTIAFATCSCLSLGMGPFISNFIARDIATVDSKQPKKHTNPLVENATQISKKYFASLDDSKAQTPVSQAARS